MGQRQYYDTKHRVLRFLNDEYNGTDTKAIVSILALELGIFLFVAYKGYAAFYFPITLILMAFSVLSCTIAFRFKADRYLLAAVLILLNLGFMVQQIQAGENLEIAFTMKLILAIITAVIVVAAYQYFAELLSRDFMIFILMGIQVAVSTIMLVFGQIVGSSEQSAAITLRHGITPFEIVKILYVFVAAGLLCKSETHTLSIGKIVISREVVLMIHTAILAVFFVLCGELGSLLIVFCSGLLLLWVYGTKRKRITTLIILSAIVFGGFWCVSDLVLYPMLAKNAISLPYVIRKLVLRFGLALHPEKALADYGYQGTLALEALSMGGLLGITSEKYRLKLPEAANDFAFANLVQTCGLVMGLIMLLTFISLLRRGIKIAEQCGDSYFQGLAAEITFMVSTETVIHIGYNIGFLPITGIPLFFVSQGFTAIISGMALISVLLVLSTGRPERLVV